MLLQFPEGWSPTRAGARHDHGNAQAQGKAEPGSSSVFSVGSRQVSALIPEHVQTCSNRLTHTPEACTVCNSKGLGDRVGRQKPGICTIRRVHQLGLNRSDGRHHTTDPRRRPGSFVVLPCFAGNANHDIGLGCRAVAGHCYGGWGAGGHGGLAVLAICARVPGRGWLLGRTCRCAFDEIPRRGMQLQRCGRRAPAPPLPPQTRPLTPKPPQHGAPVIRSWFRSS
jgi:hypothetical protein